MANKVESSLSILVFISSCRVLNWIVILEELYSCFCFFLKRTNHFLITTWEGWSRGKNADAMASNSIPKEHVENETIASEDLGRIMGKLGIVWDPNGMENQERLGFGEISSLFNETEPSIEEVKQAFDLFDENKDGFIDSKELQKMLSALGYKETSETECQRMILAFDLDGDRRIDFREFLRIVEDSFC